MIKSTDAGKGFYKTQYPLIINVFNKQGIEENLMVNKQDKGHF